jgi:hypothetical protein
MAFSFSGGILSRRIRLGVDDREVIDFGGRGILFILLDAREACSKGEGSGVDKGKSRGFAMVNDKSFSCSGIMEMVVEGSIPKIKKWTKMSSRVSTPRSLTIAEKDNPRSAECQER